MKSLSVAFTVLLFVLAGTLAAHLKRAGLLPVPERPVAMTPYTVTDAPLYLVNFPETVPNLILSSHEGF